MATVDKDSANWRLFGGGGLLVGGLLWLIAELVNLAGAASVGTWIGIVGVLLVGVALFLVAFGETGSNGAVGASVFGKIALVVFGVGWVLYGLVWLLAAIGVAAPDVLKTIAGVLVVLGGLFSAFIIYQRNVARGAARWVLFAPVLWGVLFVIAALGWVSLTGWWLGAILGLLFAITGLLYLLNRKDVG
jgi:hypothetical protein